MQCPYCQAKKTKTLDSRQSGGKRRRRRECVQCGRRFSTEEMLFEKLPVVTKADGKTEEFNDDKLRQSLQLALRKCQVSGQQMEQMIDNLKNRLYEVGATDIKSAWIGQAVMQELKNTNWVAYIRYASVYREFSDMDAFLGEIQELQRDLTPDQRSQQMSLLESPPTKRRGGSRRRRR